MIRRFEIALLGAALSCVTAAGAQAQAVYGYAEPAIRGDYIGAPFTRFPRPSQLVPSAWGYGTYGVPTVSGIPPAPVGTPTVYVIDSPAPAARAMTGRARVLQRGRGFVAAPAFAPGGARVVSVSVPRRQAALR